MGNLLRLRCEDGSIKCLVVSQFTRFLTILERPLRLVRWTFCHFRWARQQLAPISSLFPREHGFSFVRLDGSINQKRRTEVIQEFQSSTKDSPTIMLLSLKAGGVGLNLTAASHVFLMDPVGLDYSSIGFILLEMKLVSLVSHLCFRLGILLQRNSALTAATAWDRRGKLLSLRSEKRWHHHLCSFIATHKV